jgi:acetamidase/formamidase
MDLGRVNPITGPVFVRGAAPGDVLAVEILELRPKTWGWTAIIPGFGLLADEFPDPWLRISSVDPDQRTVRFAQDITLPFSPFPGTIGVAPAEPGRHSVLPPRKWGGNLDIKHLRVGTTLLVPVGVEGALFSLGDTHAAMGDAEVCGTAVETAMDTAVRLTVRKDLSLNYPQYHVPAGQLAAAGGSSYHVCTGIHSDLLEATREATREVIDHLVQRYGRDREEAYAIASVAVDLRIHEVVDTPNWVVGAFLPEDIFG